MCKADSPKNGEGGSPSMIGTGGARSRSETSTAPPVLNVLLIGGPLESDVISLLCSGSWRMSWGVTSDGYISMLLLAAQAETLGVGHGPYLVGPPGASGMTDMGALRFFRTAQPGGPPGTLPST